MRPHARRGLTLAELILASAMLGIVMMAAAGLMTAVAAAWRSSDVVTRTANVAERAGFRVEEALAGALHVFQVQAPIAAGSSSYVFFWKSDSLTGSRNGKAELGEMALLEFDPATRAIRLYEPIPAASMTAAQFSVASENEWGDPTAASLVSYFKAQDFVAAPVTIVGGQAGASEVVSATFGSFVTVGAKPQVTYAIELRQGGIPVTRDGALTLRLGQRPRNV